LIEKILCQIKKLKKVKKTKLFILLILFIKSFKILLVQKSKITPKSQRDLKPGKRIKNRKSIYLFNLNFFY
jgi:hypothetical protein